MDGISSLFHFSFWNLMDSTLMLIISFRLAMDCDVLVRCSAWSMLTGSPYTVGESLSASLLMKLLTYLADLGTGMPGINYLLPARI